MGSKKSRQVIGQAKKAIPGSGFGNKTATMGAISAINDKKVASTSGQNDSKRPFGGAAGKAVGRRKLRGGGTVGDIAATKRGFSQPGMLGTPLAKVVEANKAKAKRHLK